jgi:hypothetical protein
MTRRDALAAARTALMRYCEIQQIRTAFKLAWNEVEDEQIEHFLEEQGDRNMWTVRSALEELDRKLAEVERELEAKR